MNDETMPAFPPFIPAKPKGGVEKEIKESKRTKKSVWEKTVDNAKPPTGEPTKRRKKRKPRPATIPLDAIVGFAGLSTEEAEQVVNVCTALQTFPKGSRTRIAAALGKIFE